MQKRVVYNFNAQPATETATGPANGKAVKASNAIGKIKRAFFGKGLKLAVFVVLLFASLFCAIGSADWIISQQKDVPNAKDGTKTFNVDDFGLDKYVIVRNSTYNGNPVCAEVKDRVDGDARKLPTEAKGNVKYKVIPYNKPSAQSRLLRAPQNAASTERNKAPAANAVTSLPNEDDFKDIDYVTELPTKAGTYAVLITSVVGEVSYGKAIKVFTIAPCPVEIEWSGAVDFIYDGADHLKSINATAKTTDGTPIDGIVTKSFTYKAQGATTSTKVTEVKNAGTYTATAEITDPNYALAEGSNATKDFAISQKELTVTADNKNTIYGESAPVYTATYEGLLDCDIGKLGTPDFTCDYPTKNHDAGTYDINVSGLENSNYNISYGKGTLTVNQRTVTIAWGTKNSFVYNGNAQSRDYTAENVVTGDDLKLTVTLKCENIAVSSAINAGTYTATAQITSHNYVLDKSSKTATFTITQRTITLDWGANSFAYDGNAHTLTPTAQNVVSNDNLGLTVTVTGENLTGALAINAGTYTATAQITNANYVLAESSKTATFTITQRTLTVKAKDYEITYGDEPSANGYEISGFVNNENESVINGLENLTYIIDYAQWQDIGQFSITPKVDGLSAVNYSFKANSDGTLKVKSLNIQLSGIIEREYDDVNKSPLVFNKDLFANATFTAPQNPGIDLKKLPYDIYQYISNAGNAQNFDSTNGIAITPENGLFSYAFGKPIAAGSTYKIDKVTLNNKNFNLTETEVYLKYKTAKIDGKFYTIEEALATGGDITLCGNIDTSSDSPNSSYVITAFSKLSLSAGNGDKFKDYKSDYNYTLSGKKLIASFNNSAKEEDVQSSYKEAGDVFSALVISNGITITLSSSASMIAAAEVGFDYSICTTLAKNHGVIMNNGKIVVNSGCSVTAYGYIKGNGLIQMNSGATALDALTIYDWPGGDAAKDMYKTVFPTNAYTVHNISCPTKVFSGAIYKARVYLNALSGVAELNETVIIIGTQEKKGMFNADNNSSASDYILKSVITNQKDIETAKDINSNIALSNQRATKDTVTTLNHRDNIEIYGKYSDAPTEISKTVLFITIALKTSTSIPLPVGFMDITVRNNSTLTLNSSDYLILPGAKLTVDNGGTLTLGNNVDLVALPYAYAPTSGNYRYTRFYTANTDGNGKKDGKLIVNGTLNGSGYSLGGNISTEQAGATLNVVNASGTYITMRNSSKPYYESGTVNAFGDIMTSQSSYAQRNLSTGTYYSKKVNGKFVWYSQTATITFKANDKPYSTISRTVGANGYTITAADFPTTPPTKDYYTFDKWYIDEALTTEAVGQTVFISCTLYAGWTANTYTITYKFKYNGEEYSPENVDNSANPKTTYTCEDSFFLAPATSNDGYKFYRWYSDEACKKPITQISGKEGNITLYGEFIDAGVEVYVVTYVNSNNEVDTPSAENVKSNEAANFKPAELGEITNNDPSKSKYFLGWYIDKACKTLFNGSLTGSVTLYAGWDNKAELTIVIPNSSPILEAGVPTGKYYYKGQSVVIPDISTHPQISAMYTVPEGYKFIGFMATAGCTTTLDPAKDSSGYITGITTNVTVSNDLSKGLTITADIRKILRVDITMTASVLYYHKFPVLGTGRGTGDFKINKLSISRNSFFSTNKSDWQISDDSDVKKAEKGTQTIYLLEGSTDITVTINSITVTAIKTVWGVDHKNPKEFNATKENAKLSITGCTKQTDSSPFKFTITNSDATINWSGQTTYND